VSPCQSIVGSIQVTPDSNTVSAITQPSPLENQRRP
jgi:hypothetical protein